jgi:hypothetical protein
VVWGSVAVVRWKVFHIAGDDHVRSSDQCSGNNMFVIDVGQHKRVIQAFPVHHDGVIKRRAHSIDQALRPLRRESRVVPAPMGFCASWQRNSSRIAVDHNGRYCRRDEQRESPIR